MKKLKTSILFIGLLLLAVSARAAGVNICYQNACHLMTNYEPEQIMSQLEEIFSNNRRDILFCESDIYMRSCLNKPISFSGHSRLMQVDFKVPFARMNQVRKRGNTLDMVLDYQMKANQYYPVCSAPDSTLTLSTSWNGGIRLISPLFNCRITEFGTTKMAFRMDIDYIDLDTGYLGGSYRVNVQGDVVAEKSGYALVQVVDNRYVGEIRPFTTNTLTQPRRVGKFVPNLGQPPEKKSIFDWTADDWSKKWNSFKEKALKVIYLEPLE